MAIFFYNKNTQKYPALKELFIILPWYWWTCKFWSGSKPFDSEGVPERIFKKVILLHSFMPKPLSAKSTAVP